MQWRHLVVSDLPTPGHYCPRLPNKSTKDIVKIHAKGSDVGKTMYGNTNRSQSVCHRLVCGPTALPLVTGLGLGDGHDVPDV